MEEVKLEIVTLIITAIIGIPSYVFIYDRWVTPWRKRVKEKNTPKFGKEYFKCLWCKKYAKHEIGERERVTDFLYTTCTKCSKKLIWSNREHPQIVEPLKLQRRCISCKKVSLHELEDAVTKEIRVDQETGDLFYLNITTDVSYASIEDFESALANSSNKPKIYIPKTMECYARRCLNKKCEELHYWTEDNRIIWKRNTKTIKFKTT